MLKQIIVTITTTNVHQDLEPNQSFSRGINLKGLRFSPLKNDWKRS